MKANDRRRTLHDIIRLLGQLASQHSLAGSYSSNGMTNLNADDLLNNGHLIV